MTETQTSEQIIVLVKIKVKEKALRDYLEVAEQTSLAIKNYEKDTLSHNLYSSAESPNELSWSIIFKNMDSLKSYFNSPIIALYFANHKVLAEEYRMDVYGITTEVEIKELLKLGITIRIYPPKFGYDRIN